MGPGHSDDADLLRAHCRGDAHAFARLYDRYDQPCFHFIRRMLGGNAIAADDLHQETWLAVARNAATFDPRKAAFASWLFTIARHKVLDHHRRRQVIPLGDYQDDAALETLRDPGPSPVEQVESRQLAEKLVAAVEGLPLEQRGAFILFADAGLSLEEIAQVTGVPIETAKSRLRYARDRLRRSLADEWSAHA
jgi:RNA polymerase sigma-70 factor (ECF subfamily)